VTEPGHPEPQEIDWAGLAQRFQETTTRMIHHEDGSPRYGNNFYAEALRRTFGYQPAGAPPRELPYPVVNPSTGLTTTAAADHIRDGHTVLDRLARADAERQRDEAREEAHRVLRDAARDLAKLIRGCTNERTVPSRYRREGVLLAADWIDPDSPASPYTI
jgi:hypothetical protein